MTVCSIGSCQNDAIGWFVFDIVSEPMCQEHFDLFRVAGNSLAPPGGM